MALRREIRDPLEEEKNRHLQAIEEITKIWRDNPQLGVPLKKCVDILTKECDRYTKPVKRIPNPQGKNQYSGEKRTEKLQLTMIPSAKEFLDNMAQQQNTSIRDLIRYALKETYKIDC